MSHLVSRRAFFKGRVSEGDYLRPPGAAAESDFRAACNSCGDCIPVCPENILTADPDGRPAIRFATGACTFCNACIDACETGALRPGQGSAHLAEVAASCLAESAVSCRTCEDQCDEGAIRFRLALGGRASPLIDASLCNGCGACVAPCPAAAIRITRRPTQQELKPC
ncbi:MAG: ferredoxin-type protein NapF [Rhodobacteraceae bacterium]|nr:ferredoxin-type protein NapF [Paracoccaceae bacterium]